MTEETPQIEITRLPAQIMDALRLLLASQEPSATGLQERSVLKKRF
ncbi:MAG: hypothetical protein HC780_04585 [Leptolyngbyaceae cyanobacterium CSU_1_3]|nr:hypothetical protein [Leptolyngbyaceae cyanobacterium CSU_1_3]